MKKDMWCAFKSIGAVKIKQPKERALDRLYCYVQRELSGFPTTAYVISKSLKSQVIYEKQGRLIKVEDFIQGGCTIISQPVTKKSMVLHFGCHSTTLGKSCIPAASSTDLPQIFSEQKAGILAGALTASDNHGHFLSIVRG
jgi:hypothetical protein